MRKPYSSMFSAKLIPEVALLDDREEIDRVLKLSRSNYRRRTVVASIAFGVWIGTVGYASKHLAARFGISPRWASTVIPFIAAFVGVFWLHNYALRKPFQQAAREILQERGVPICVGCGYDLRGQTEPRCPECGRPFDDDLLKHGETGRPDGEPADEAPR